MRPIVPSSSHGLGRKPSASHWPEVLSSVAIAAGLVSSAYYAIQGDSVTGPRAFATNHPITTALLMGGVIGRVASLWRQKRVEKKPTSAAEILDSWVNATGISPEERTDREEVKRRILEANPTNGLHVNGVLCLDHFENLTGLPEGLSVADDLSLDGCTGLTQLPEGLSVAGDLSLDGCTGLTQLPEGLSVAGDLHLDGCTGLTQLPEGLSVGVHLYLTGCTGLTQLPEGLSVGGYLILHGCTGLTQLPTDILTWGLMRYGTTRHIVLEGSGISQEMITRIQDANPPGMQFHFSVEEAPTHQEFSTLPEAFDFWRQLTGDHAQLTQNDIPTWQLDTRYETTLVNYLGRLKGTADYKNPETRPILAARVMDLLSHLGDSELRDSLLSTMGDAMISCDDRTILAMNNMEIKIRLHDIESQNNPDLVRNLGISLMKLDVVDKHAMETIKKLEAARQVGDPKVDDVEVYLAYHTCLLERLDLPISTHYMLFRVCSGVTDQDIETAAQAALDKANDEAAVAAYLQTWGPWQKILRKQQIDKLSYDTMPEQRLVIEDLDNAICLFTQEPWNKLEQPVYIQQDNTWRVYEFNALCTWWIEHGTDPLTKIKIEPSNWFKLIQS